MRVEKIIKMVNFVGLIFAILTLQIVLQAKNSHAFWLTDLSFTPPRQQQAAIQLPVVDQSRVVGADSSPQEKGNTSRTQTEAPQWIQVGSVGETHGKEASQTSVTQATSFECQCNSNWIKNHTDYYIAKWLHEFRRGPNRSGNNGKDAKQSNKRSEASNADGLLNNHWNAWVKSRVGSSVGGGGNNGMSSRFKKSHQNHRQQQQQQQREATSELKLARGERGPEGPKGEQGPRGEKGERGDTGPLISVKDRDELFDLYSLDDKQVPAANQQQPAKRLGNLVFVQSEQLLVINTNSGWRPVQMLAPLRDFRQNIAKFTLSSAEERRRLMSSENMDNSIRSIARYDEQQVVGLPVPRPSARSDTKVDEDDNDSTMSKEIDDIDDGDDGDEDEDDEDEDDGDDVDDDDGLSDEEDDDLDDASSSTRKIKASRQSNRIAPVAARSAAAAVPSIENSAVRSPSRHRAKGSNDGRSKLRIAALNEPFSGNVHGIRGADFECRRNAARAQIKGSFRAFLASGYQNLDEIVRHNVHKCPVVNLRGDVLANSWYDLFRRPTDGANPLSKILSFDGRHVGTDPRWPNKLVWLGAANKFGQRDAQNNCDSWHSDSLNKFGSAAPLHLPRATHRRHKKRYILSGGSPETKPANASVAEPAPVYALEQIDKFPCRMPLIVLCIETVGQQSMPVGSGGKMNENDL